MNYVQIIHVLKITCEKWNIWGGNHMQLNDSYEKFHGKRCMKSEMALISQHCLILWMVDWCMHSTLFSVQIYLPRPDAIEPDVKSMSIKYGVAATTHFNITDPNSTVIVTAIPNQNVSLLLLLSPTYQSNNSSQRTILTGNGEEYSGEKKPHRDLYNSLRRFNHQALR